jgi:hypothetical protein
MSNTVEYSRDDYTHALKDWRLVADVCDGERAIKKAGDKYLPIPNPTDESAENKKRYEQYKTRAVFLEATSNTLEGLIGSAFRKNPVLTIPAGLKYATSDVDGMGLSINQQAQDTLGSVLKKGRRFLFVDYPKTEKQASKADQSKGLVRPSIISIEAEKVRNWRVEKFGGAYRLSLVVIEETHEAVTEDGFGVKIEPQYRVLKLINGQYIIEVWRKAGNSKVWSVYGTHFVANSDGNGWDKIPGLFVGARNNDDKIDKAPLIGLASLNLAHYRNSADYEDSVFFNGRAQSWMSGLSTEWRDFLQQEGIAIGSNKAILLPVGGAFGFAQVRPNTLAKEAMDQKEHQMVALGAKLIERGQVAKTATESRSETDSQHSVLSLAIANVNDAYTTLLGWMTEFVGGAGQVSYKINTELAEYRIDAQLLTSLVAAWQAGKLPSSDLWAQFRKFGLIDEQKTDEGIKSELEAEGEGLGLDDFSTVT